MNKSTSNSTQQMVRATPVQKMLTATSVVLGATLFAAAAAGGTYGLWAGAAPVDAGIVTTGSLALATGAPTVSPTAWTGMFPGDRVRQSTTLTNTGSVSADVNVQTSAPGAAASSYEVRIAKGSCPTTALTSTNSIAATPIALGIWAANETSAVCIEVTMRANATQASQGASVPFTFTFGATQRVS